LIRSARALIFLAALCGCNRAVDTAAPPVSPPEIGARFDAKDVGAIAGQVHWAGYAPNIPLISAPVTGPDGKLSYRQFANPNSPRLNLGTGTVQGAVIFLEGVQPERSRPWDHALVRVAVSEERIEILQGDAGRGRIGFVRVGDEVEIESRDASLHLLSARGAAFFGLPLPDAGKPVRRRLTQPGLVELSSGAGRYWHRAYLWVGAHSYFALSDDDGWFKLARVPAGEYRVVAWLPNPDVAAIDRDPNTGMILRQHYGEPLLCERTLRVEAGHTAEVDFWFSK
jgi:hypothetical protein